MKKSVLFLLSFLLGCTVKTDAPIHISMVNQSLRVTGLDAAIIGEIGRDSSVGVWQSLVPVYRMPADTDMKDYQHVQPGKYMVEGDAVIFTPDTPFLKNQAYFVRWYQYSKGSTFWDHIKHHEKLGKQPYQDLIFKQ
jgi:hypothetical protein